MVRNGIVAKEVAIESQGLHIGPEDVTVQKNPFGCRTSQRIIIEHETNKACGLKLTVWFLDNHALIGLACGNNLLPQRPCASSSFLREWICFIYAAQRLITNEEIIVQVLNMCTLGLLLLCDMKKPIKYGVQV